MMGNFFWQDNENFIDDGIQIEPFNLNKEREEGYFDADGNFVEYVNENEIKVKHCIDLKLLNIITKLVLTTKWFYRRMRGLIVLKLK